MLRTSVRACAIAIFVMIGVASCDRKSGEAVVIGKEHIDAALPTAGVKAMQLRLSSLNLSPTAEASHSRSADKIVALRCRCQVRAADTDLWQSRRPDLARGSQTHLSRR